MRDCPTCRRPFAEEAVCRRGDLTYWPRTRRVACGNVSIVLCQQQGDVLAVLMRTGYAAHETIALAMTTEAEDLAKLRNVLVCRLRAAIERIGSRMIISSDHGRGYELSAAEERAAA